MKVGDREYCLAQRLVCALGERQNLQKIAASTLRSALATVADLERQLEQAVESHTAQGYEAYKARRWAAAWKAAAKRMRRLCQSLTIQRDTILEKLNRAASQGVLSEGRIMELEAALGNILLDMDKAQGEGRQYMPLEDER